MVYINYNNSIEEFKNSPLSIKEFAFKRARKLASDLKIEISILALEKGNENYILLYDDESRVEALRTLGRWASKDELSFTWFDAAVLSQKMRQESCKQKHSLTNRIGNYLE